MEPWLKAKTLGLPRWGWAIALGGAVIVGLYLRKRAAESEAEGTVSGEESALAEEGGVGYSEGGAGLGVAGLVGPAAGQVVPVEVPTLPPGFEDILGSLTTLITEMHHDEKEEREHRDELDHPENGGGPPETPAGSTHEVPIPSVPAASCPTATVQALEKNKKEIDRLGKEINELQADINQLTSNINAHPHAKQVNEWKQQRTADQTKIQAKRGKVTTLSGINQGLRKIPGCDKVRI